MERKETPSLPPFPDGRPCAWPSARRVLDLGESIARPTRKQGHRLADVMATERSRTQPLLALLGLAATRYGHRLAAAG